jgi:hypothetical protein
MKENNKVVDQAKEWFSNDFWIIINSKAQVLRIVAAGHVNQFSLAWNNGLSPIVLFFGCDYCNILFSKFDRRVYFKRLDFTIFVYQEIPNYQKGCDFDVPCRFVVWETTWKGHIRQGSQFPVKGVTDHKIKSQSVRSVLSPTIQSMLIVK